MDKQEKGEGLAPRSPLLESFSAGERKANDQETWGGKSEERAKRRRRLCQLCPRMLGSLGVLSRLPVSFLAICQRCGRALGQVLSFLISHGQVYMAPRGEAKIIQEVGQELFQEGSI